VKDNPPERATDNAIMIALAGYFRAIRNKYTDSSNLKADGNLTLGDALV
jgi:tRNA A37 threonylcarbamoyltransferase TsaD